MLLLVGYSAPSACVNGVSEDGELVCTSCQTKLLGCSISLTNKVCYYIFGIETLVSILSSMSSLSFSKMVSDLTYLVASALALKLGLLAS